MIKPTGGWPSGNEKRHFEIELPIIKQSEFELAAEFGSIRQIQ